MKKPVVGDIPKVMLKSFDDMKSELDSFFDEIVHELADTEMYDRIACKKVEFINWLKQNNLYTQITNLTLIEPATELEWECTELILTYLKKFDLFMLQCIHNTESLMYSDMYLRKRMSKFSKEYDGELSIL